MDVKASIDIGTNSTRLLIAQTDNKNNIIPITMVDRITQLGKGMDRNGKLSSEAMHRVINVLTEYRTLIDRAGAVETVVYATSATRDAGNRSQFLKLISEKTGFTCRIISGAEEARLSFTGVRSDFKISGKSVICDIGGGSTEFIFAEQGKILFSHSLQIGSRRLTTKFFRHDPVTKQELENIQIFLKNELTEHLAVFSPEQCICVGGTATTLAMMHHKIPIAFPEKSHLQIIKLKNIENIIHTLSVKSIRERQKIIGLHPDRADVILTGALIVGSILEHFNLTESIISLRDLLFGILLSE
ncbi:Ppx/GppA family phosphatase [candidate division KSB1 bacterium]|nr:Ppx/GppA family phosphatase [candidate division KSB1 bacterium]